MQQHQLDNPVWNALISGNQTLANGTDTVKFFHEEVSPIVGLESFTKTHFDTLYNLFTTEKPVVIFSVDAALSFPSNWKQVAKIHGYQMLFTAPLPAIDEKVPVTRLTQEYLPQMLALTSLTNPGPFSSRTPEFGNYEGIIINGKLAAMAGQRLFPSPYVEISAVCTHPDYVGKGFARQLLIRQIHQIVTSGNIPFLHVKDDNTRAVSVYRKLGFEVRTPVYFYVLHKDSSAT